jgi:hypothetical protein
MRASLVAVIGPGKGKRSAKESYVDMTIKPLSWQGLREISNTARCGPFMRMLSFFAYVPRNCYANAIGRAQFFCGVSRFRDGKNSGPK